MKTEWQKIAGIIGKSIRKVERLAGGRMKPSERSAFAVEMIRALGPKTTPSLRELADCYGCSHERVRQIELDGLLRIARKVRPGSFPGETGMRQLQDIRFPKGILATDIARLAGVSPDAIRNFIKTHRYQVTDAQEAANAYWDARRNREQRSAVVEMQSEIAKAIGVKPRTIENYRCSHMLEYSTVEEGIEKAREIRRQCVSRERANTGFIHHE